MLDPACSAIIESLDAIIQDAETTIDALKFYQEGLTVEEAPMGELGDLMGQLKRVPKAFEAYTKAVMPLKELCRKRAISIHVEKVKQMVEISGLEFTDIECGEPCIRGLVQSGDIERARTALLELATSDARWKEYFIEALDEEFSGGKVLNLLNEYIVHESNSDVFFGSEEDSKFHRDDIDGLPGSWN